jgi:serine/threonine-protein kinase ULK/ATG1
MLFARPPFVAKNIVNLLKNINRKKLKFPKHINNISKTCEDVLRRMLTVDPRKRITWRELFKHRINTYREEKIKNELESTLKADELGMSISKFYISQNKVIQHPVEIERKQDINEYTLRLARGQNKKKEEFQGRAVKRRTKR